MTSLNQERWREALLPIGSTLRDATRSLNESALQIALVVAPDGVFSGTITDGDIRRGLLRGLDLDSPIEGIVYRDSLVVPPSLDRAIVLRLMQANKVHQLPVIDGERRVVGLHLLDDLIVPVVRPNLMVIMAGGQGARLRPSTETCPKPLLPVGGRPMLEHIITRAKGEGFRRFVVAVHYLGHMIEDHFGDGARWQVRIDYLREEGPLGTAGGISLLDPKPDLPFLVSNGDVLTDIRYGELLDFHAGHRAAATMAVRQHEWQHPFGVVRTEGLDIVGIDEKPVSRTYIAAGIYILEPIALNALDRAAPCDMPDLFRRLKERGEKTIAYPMHEPWLDIGRPEDLARAAALDQSAGR